MNCLPLFRREIFVYCTNFSSDIAHSGNCLSNCLSAVTTRMSNCLASAMNSQSYAVHSLILINSKSRSQKMTLADFPKFATHSP